MASVSARESNFSQETIDFIQDELTLLKQSVGKLTHATMGASLSSMVRFQISFSQVKTLTLCLHLPDAYPNDALVSEIRSKSLGHKLTEGLTRLADEEAKKLIGNRQILPIVEFVHNWIRDNPLCAAADEISKVKNDFLVKANGDKVKLDQTESKVVITLRKGEFTLVVQVVIPNDYPLTKCDVLVLDCNLPLLLRKHVEGHCQELARRCVQKPIYRGEDKKMLAKVAAWEPSPLLQPLAEFICSFFRDCSTQLCPTCGKLAIDGYNKSGVGLERVYCGHLYHYSCLDQYMKAPPFSDGKPCLHSGCKKLIYHDKWRTSAQVMEARWAAQQAKQRELAEVADFLS